MKTMYILALGALMLMASASVYAVENTCVLTEVDGQYKTICPNCAAPAWDQTPVYIQPQGRGPFAAPPPRPDYVAVDPWSALCGAFCEAGQVPVGWPYGWTDEYWLRPDSNL